ncbi:Hypothetical protein GLP15_2461 [Giardia lamblia P15]|uniref:Nudix hydrolase domain-containing protein n=1 Tax=Giardia intestinalis (strain P15) TaxID=658858 RepID=E1F6R2_GIAIA|nr:Hypothetical protein GLP15_2461 [Giardia lamblia P15]
MEREEVPVFDPKTLEIIGTKYRDELTKEDIHGIVCVIVENSARQIFMQVRSHTKKLYPGAFDLSASGFVRAGERFEESASRELAEEIGLIVDPSELSEKLVFRGMLAPSEYPCYTCVYKVQTDEPPLTLTDEVEDGKWFVLNELRTAMQVQPKSFTQLAPLVLNQVYP